jgi:hypothetical protein
VLRKLGQAGYAREENEEGKRKTAGPIGLAWGGFEKSAHGR